MKWFSVPSLPHFELGQSHWSPSGMPCSVTRLGNCLVTGEPVYQSRLMFVAAGPLPSTPSHTVEHQASQNIQRNVTIIQYIVHKHLGDPLDLTVKLLTPEICTGKQFEIHNKDMS